MKSDHKLLPIAGCGRRSVPLAALLLGVGRDEHRTPTLAIISRQA